MQAIDQHAAGILQRLKAGTADAHRRVEQRLDIFDDEFDLARYTLLLQRFYGFWAPVELQLRRRPELFDPALGLDDRLKAHLLEADLSLLGMDPALVARCSDLPRLDTFSQALGCMYVLEGSTLGSQIIARHLMRRFQIGRDSGASFFNAYGGAVGARWTEFRKFLTAHSDDSTADKVLGGACETFDRLDEWLALTTPSNSSRGSVTRVL